MYRLHPKRKLCNADRITHENEITFIATARFCLIVNLARSRHFAAHCLTNRLFIVNFVAFLSVFPSGRFGDYSSGCVFRNAVSENVSRTGVGKVVRSEKFRVVVSTCTAWMSFSEYFRRPLLVFRGGKWKVR